MSRPRRGAGDTLEYLLRAYTGPHHDVRPAGSIIPVAVSPVRPSPPLPHHAGRCGDIPMLLGRTGTRHRHNGHCAMYGLPVNGTLELAHHGGRSTNHCTDTLEAAPVRAQDAPRRLNVSGIHQDSRQLCSTVRHAATCIETAPSLAYKRRGSPPAAGTRDDGQQPLTRSPPSPTILALTSIKPLGLGDHASSPTLRVSTPLRAPRCEQYSAPSTPLLNVRPRPEPG
jgi:hypothetical protein